MCKLNITKNVLVAQRLRENIYMWATSYFYLKQNENVETQDNKIIRNLPKKQKDWILTQDNKRIRKEQNPKTSSLQVV